MKKEMILVIGANGQLGNGLMAHLRREHRIANVIVADKLNVTDSGQLMRLVMDRNVTQIYLLEPIRTKNAQYAVGSSWNLQISSLITV